MTKSAGPTAKALAGVTHGIQSLVPPDKVQVLTTVTITNTTRSVIRYTPAQFLLYATRGAKPGPGDRPIHLARASVPPGALQPNASIDVTLTYMAPRNGSRLWVSFRDRAAPSGPLRPRTNGPDTPSGASTSTTRTMSSLEDGS